MAPPKPSKGQILEALKRFDKELRDSEDWLNWTENRSHRFALRHQGALYPPKTIVALAAGVQPATFSGGASTNDYLARLKFEIIELRLRQPPQVPPVVQFAAEAMLTGIITVLSVQEPSKLEPRILAPLLQLAAALANPALQTADLHPYIIQEKLRSRLRDLLTERGKDLVNADAEGLQTGWPHMIHKLAELDQRTSAAILLQLLAPAADKNV